MRQLKITQLMNEYTQSEKVIACIAVIALFAYYLYFADCPRIEVWIERVRQLGW